jgi:hypothetical protein
MNGNFILGFVDAPEPEEKKHELAAPTSTPEPIPDDVVIEYLDGEVWETYRDDVPHNVLLTREALHQCARAIRKRVRATQGGKVLSLK